MLSGLLHPSAGEASVLGYVPWRRENAYLSRMTLLMGNRTQLVWDIPAADSFRVLQEIYRIPAEQFRSTVSELTELLELQELVHKPVRNLSLAERMAPYKIITATLHDGAASSTDLDAYGSVVSREEGRVMLRVDRQLAPERTARLVNDLGSRLADTSVEDPPIEEVIDRVFTSERTTVSA